MKKRISVLLALVLLCALTQAAFADEAKENSELAQQIRQMAETLHSFEKEHPEYLEAWNEYIDEMQQVHTRAFIEAFENIRAVEKENAGKAEAAGKTSDENQKAIEELEVKALDLVNRDFMIQIGKVFTIFGFLAEDGEFAHDFKMDKEAPEPQPVTEEELKAVLDGFDALKKADPEIEERFSVIFRERNRVLVEEFAKAHEKAKEEMSGKLEEIFEKYQVPADVRETIRNYVSMLTAQINENFLAAAAGNTVLGPISFKKAE